MIRQTEPRLSLLRLMCEAVGLVLRFVLLSVIAAYMLGFLWAALSDPVRPFAAGF
jgi:hypothetical protein